MGEGREGLLGRWGTAHRRMGEGRKKQGKHAGWTHLFSPRKAGEWMDAISLSWTFVFALSSPPTMPCNRNSSLGRHFDMARSCFRKSGRVSWLREMECFPSGNFGTSCQSPSLAALFRLPSYEKTCPVTRFHESQPTYCIVEIFSSRNILFFFRSSKSVQAIFSFLPILYSPLSPPFSPYPRPGLQILLPPPSPPLPLPFKENRNFLCPPFLLLLLPFLMSFQRRTRVGIACFAFAAVGLVWE